MKNAVFRDVVLCASCMNRRFGGTRHLHLQGIKNTRARKVLDVCYQTSDCNVKVIAALHDANERQTLDHDVRLIICFDQPKEIKFRVLGYKIVSFKSTAHVVHIAKTQSRSMFRFPDGLHNHETTYVACHTGLKYILKMLPHCNNCSNYKRERFELQADTIPKTQITPHIHDCTENYM
jgi:hypothetical protein